VAIAVILAIPLLACILFPPVERAHREYYHGKDQFQWASQLAADDVASRHEAIAALCEIVRTSTHLVTRWWIVQELGGHGPEAKEAIPVLAELIKGEDDELRFQARRAIQQIDPAAPPKIPDGEEGTQSQFYSSVYSPIRRLGATVTWTSENPDEPGVKVTLTDRSVTDDKVRQLVQHLKRWKSVETLDLGHAAITDAGLECLTGLESLKSLSLAYTEITDVGLQHIGRLPRLQSLWLTGTHVSDSGLGFLRQLRGLRVLFLGETKITEAGLVHLRGMTSLRLLWLTDLRISDAGLTNLGGLSQLEDLNLAANPTTDGATVTLKRLPRLRKLNVYGTSITSAGLQELHTRLPSVEVYH
jgi:hypothetical protein